MSGERVAIVTAVRDYYREMSKMAHLQCINSLSVLVEIKLQKHGGGFSTDSSGIFQNVSCLGEFYMFTPIRANNFDQADMFMSTRFVFHTVNNRISVNVTTQVCWETEFFKRFVNNIDVHKSKFQN